MSKSKIQILCTIGPSSLNQKTITKLEKLGVSLLRINLSHTQIDDLPNVIETLRSFSNLPICLDSEGAQIRTGDIQGAEIYIRDNSIIKISNKRIPGNSFEFNFHPLAIVDQFQVGDFLSIDFNSVLAQVINKYEDGVVLRVINGGKVGRNKAVTLSRSIEMPAFTEKDLEAFQVGIQYKIEHYALSFAHKEEDVQDLRNIVGDKSFIISKIECKDGVKNLKKIAERSDAILIDRGDLSREFPIQYIPMLQKKIIAESKKCGLKVYVATNLLESMIVAPTPTRAEVNDIYNTILDGADGLVLAAETAIGKYPELAAEMISKVIQIIENKSEITSKDSTFFELESSLLTAPHGGTLIIQEEEDNVKHDSVLVIDETDLLDAEQISSGTYSPISGFMNEAELGSVLNNYKTPEGVIWTMPIILQVSKEKASKIAADTILGLADSTGEVLYHLKVESTYKIDLDAVAKKWFGTSSEQHPGVKRVYSKGEYVVSGKVFTLNKNKSNFKEFLLTPQESRFIFQKKGWSKIVGFHTRNVPHRAHEHIQKLALEKIGADGLYITPVIGPKKSGDFQPLPILRSYQALIDFDYYPLEKVMLGAFATYSRYCGPREAVFTALCRKNMGCSDFIIGRDHTGVGDYYRPEENAELFEKLGDVGINPLFFDEYSYNSITKKFECHDNKNQNFVRISGTEARNKIRNDEKLPTWYMRDVVQNVISDYNKKGSVFC